MGENVNIHEYLDMARRRKWCIVAIVAISLVLGAFKMYRNYVSYVPTYTSRVVVKIDTMKTQKEEARKKREEESKKNNKSDSAQEDSNQNDSSQDLSQDGSSDEALGSNGYLDQEDDTYNLYNYSAISQDESIAKRYYSYATDSAIYDKVAYAAGVRSGDVLSIGATQDEDRPEIITISVTSSNAKSAQMIAAAMPQVYGDELLKETGIDCVATVYDATEGAVIPRATDTSILKYTMAGLVIAIFIVLLLEVLNTKIITPEDIEKHWELPLLGVVPMFEDGPHPTGRK
ncbi:MAG: hypothetical protein Q4E31_09500 [Intestinibacter bartlettii]|uniref:hypothetical protein n=1 Tax=Intestinibacter bartlettii TaxID=261299 RepID=UPI0026E92C16|nr:hypothetical protein [Intestinibacter bartlettii]MDO5011048.1 hypothetical protein [Intestinibacter bartlettii]